MAEELGVELLQVAAERRFEFGPPSGWIVPQELRFRGEHGQVFGVLIAAAVDQEIVECPGFGVGVGGLFDGSEAFVAGTWAT